MRDKRTHALLAAVAVQVGIRFEMQNDLTLLDEEEENLTFIYVGDNKGDVLDEILREQGKAKIPDELFNEESVESGLLQDSLQEKGLRVLRSNREGSNHSTL